MDNNFDALYGEPDIDQQKDLDEIEHHVLGNISTIRSVSGLLGDFLERLTTLIIIWLGGKPK